jgi:asparagine synthase (glutamine-hydrolysing)
MRPKAVAGIDTTMCGICGIGSTVPKDSLAASVAKMNAALAHRGPDDGGQFDGETCSIAMRRLSIIDLATGHQPINNEDSSLMIVFNGEIYNFGALRKQLEKTGRHVFRTQTDTEVILHLYEDRRSETPRLLHGMFAFCIYDRRDKTMFLARDRFGEKPLYYSIQAGALAFSSELDSLLHWSEIPRRLDYEALYYLLHLGYIPAPLTLFEGVRQLPAGHWMRWGRDCLRIESFYEPVYEPDPHLQDEGAAIEALRETLIRAVSDQMVADVPLGAFLSGGIDSSTIVAAMQQTSNRPVKTFTARFEYAPYDESRIARAVAEHLGTDHHEVVITNKSFDDEDLWRIVRHFGQPFMDSSAIPTYFVSREIRRNVTVALSGDGGDEIFAGYPFFLQARSLDRLASLPSPLLTAGSRTLDFASKIPFALKLSALRMARRVMQVARLPSSLRPGAIDIIFDLDALLRIATPILHRRWENVSDTATQEILDSVKHASRLRQLMHYRIKYSLAEDMLPKVDRMSMATSLEARAPLLSAEVTDLAMRLPDRLLIRDGVQKFILREVGRPWLPDIVYSHPKTGFSIPLHMFQNENYSRLCRQYLTENKSPIITELFDRAALIEVVARGEGGHFVRASPSARRVTHQLWGLLQLGAWAEYYAVSL